MPSREDLRQQVNAIGNPFDEEPPRINEYTAKEIATLQSRLDKQLGPEYISSRQGPGGSKVHYLAADKVINLANEVFGFNGWSSSIRDTSIDFVDVDKDGRISMGLSMIMRITLKDGTYHEDIGYGTCTNIAGKGAAFEKTKKEAATDAMKRSLRSFGNVLGNCLYDKDYLKRIVKVKAPTSKWNEEDLHRHPEFVPRPEPQAQAQAECRSVGKGSSGESSTEKATSIHPTRTASAESARSASTTDYGDDEFGGNAFDDIDFMRTDEFAITEMDTSEVAAKVETKNQVRPLHRLQSLPNMRPLNAGSNTNSSTVPSVDSSKGDLAAQQMRPPLQQRQPSLANTNNSLRSETPTVRGPQQHLEQKPNGPQIQSRDPVQNTNSIQQRQSIQPQVVSTGATGAQISSVMEAAPVGFVTGRAADMIQGAQSIHISPDVTFNPHAESPSIRKTNGVNHRRSGPVRRDDVGAPSASPVPNVAQLLPHVANGQARQPNQPMTSTKPSQVGQPQQNVSPAMNTRSNFINPQQDFNRRIGMPQSPGPMTRGAYRPPAPVAGVKRPPLGDVSNVNTNVQKTDGDVVGSDGKRAKLVDGGVDGTDAVGIVA